MSECELDREWVSRFNDFGCYIWCLTHRCWHWMPPPTVQPPHTTRHPQAARANHPSAHAEAGQTMSEPEKDVLLTSLKYWRDRADDIRDDCETGLDMKNPAILGIHTVAEQLRDSIDHFTASGRTVTVPVEVLGVLKEVREMLGQHLHQERATCDICFLITRIDAIAGKEP